MFQHREISFAVPTGPAPKRSKPSPLQHSSSCNNLEATPQALRAHKRASSNMHCKVTNIPSLAMPATISEEKENYPLPATTRPTSNASPGQHPLSLSMSMEVLPSYGSTDQVMTARPLSFSCETDLRRSPISLADCPKPLLPLVPGSADVATINAATMADLLSAGPLRANYEKIVIVDARFPYEYDGGHIKGAINIDTPADLQAYFFGSFEGQELLSLGKQLCIIFHCEFSSHRGPKLFRCLRKLDRQMNSYPNLTWPEMYLLEGGYRHFFGNFRNLCYPDQYIEMRDPNYEQELKEAMKEHLRNVRKSRSRSCSELDLTQRKAAQRAIAARQQQPSNDMSGSPTSPAPVFAPLQAFNPSSASPSSFAAMFASPPVSFADSPSGTLPAEHDVMEVEDPALLAPPVVSPFHTRSCSSIDFSYRQKRQRGSAPAPSAGPRRQPPTSPVASLTFSCVSPDARQAETVDETPRVEFPAARLHCLPQRLAFSTKTL